MDTALDKKGWYILADKTLKTVNVKIGKTNSSHKFKVQIPQELAYSQLLFVPTKNELATWLKESQIELTTSTQLSWFLNNDSNHSLLV
jgi:hypothetical protein